MPSRRRSCAHGSGAIAETSSTPSRQASDDLRNVDRVDVQRALAGLPRRQRQIAVLRYFLQMDTREVADALGVSEGTVKNSLSKARDALAAHLQIDEQEENDVEA
ncbi:MAG: sigma-70 family RNA polymerase sigma factor [Actinobacteria bacterium]|nr:MAG: sigma-70 family RNA polymerase sigma factor [Actinomycetota bacterium]